MEGKRGTWNSNFGFIMAAVGSAVGLGNIWGFPYKMGSSGGFAFLLVYLIMAVLIGSVVMMGELAMGRRSGRGAVGAYAKLASRRFRWVGWMGVLSAFLIMSFYSVLGGYCLKYMVVNLGDLLGMSFGSNGLNGGDMFTLLLKNQVECVIYTLIIMVIGAAIVMGGISGGIERFSKYAMPALFILLIVVIVRSVTLEGAGEGLAFMFSPNFEPFEKDFLSVLSLAGGQMFFSLSLGMGIMITYGSYLPRRENIQRNALVVIFADTAASILSGLAVIPAAFALGGDGAAMAGPKLLYVTLHNVFNSMGDIGPFIGMLFYLLVVIATVTSVISLIEVITTFFMDNAANHGKTGNRRKITLLVSAAIMALATLVAADGLGTNGVWMPFQIFGVSSWNDCWLSFMDMLSEGVMMPLGALLMCLFISYEWGVDRVVTEIERCGDRFAGRRFFTLCFKVLAPLGMIFILWGQLEVFGLV